MHLLLSMCLLFGTLGSAQAQSLEGGQTGRELAMQLQARYGSEPVLVLLSEDAPPEWINTERLRSALQTALPGRSQVRYLDQFPMIKERSQARVSRQLLLNLGFGGLVEIQLSERGSELEARVSGWRFLAGQEHRIQSQSLRFAEPVSAEEGGCGDLSVMELGARMGKLTEEQLECLDLQFHRQSSPVLQDPISRVLIMNSEVAQRDDWALLMERHLKQVSRADPSMCFSYASYLAQLGVTRSWEVIEWVDLAMENRQQWPSAVFGERVAELHRLRTLASAQLWQSASESNLALPQPNQQLQAEEERLRGMTKNYAREWLDYARALGVSSEDAYDLCVSAAGTRRACGRN